MRMIFDVEISPGQLCKSAYSTGGHHLQTCPEIIFDHNRMAMVHNQLRNLHMRPRLQT